MVTKRIFYLHAIQRQAKLILGDRNKNSEIFNWEQNTDWEAENVLNFDLGCSCMVLFIYKNALSFISTYVN